MAVGSEDLFAKFTVRQETSESLFAELVVRQEGSQDLKATFILPESEDLFAEFVVRQSATQDLFAKFYVGPEWGTFGPYRKLITITEISDGSYTDYPTIITVPYQAGMELDFTDCRFAEWDGTTARQFGLVEKTDGVEAKYVLLLSHSRRTKQYFFIYWGRNLSAGQIGIGTWVNNWYLNNGFGQQGSAYISQNCNNYEWSKSGVIPKWAVLAMGGVNVPDCSYRAFYGRSKLNGVHRAWASTVVCDGLTEYTTLKWKVRVCSTSMYDDPAFNYGVSNTIEWGHYQGGNPGMWVSYYPTDPSVSLGTTEEQSDSEDLFAEFIVRHTDALDLKATFDVGQDSVDLKAVFDVGQGVEDLFADFIVRQASYQDRFSKMVIRHGDAEDVFAKFIVRNSSSKDLKATFHVGQDSADLFTKIIVRRSTSRDLFACFKLPGEHHLDGWMYRKGHRVVGTTAGAQTDYQVGIKVYYGAGVDGTETVYGVSFGKIYCNSKCKPDFGDIRFTKWDGETELDYWLEEKTDSNYALFWVEIDALPKGPLSEMIYVYYGNSAPTTSSGEDTFNFFDDFEDEDIDDPPDATKWTISVPSGYILIKANPSGSGKVLDIYSIDDGNYTWAQTKNWTDIGEAAVCFKNRQSINGDGWTNWLYCHHNRVGASIFSESWDRFTTTRDYHNGSTYVNYTPACGYAINTWYRQEFKFLSGSAVMNNNGTNHTGGYRNPYGSPINVRPHYRGHSERAGHTYVDNVYVRKLRNPEPTHGTWGPEEQFAVDLFAKFYVKQGASVDLKATFHVGQDAVDLFADLEIRHSSHQELFADLVIRNEGYADLFAKFVVRQPSDQELFAKFTIRQIASRDLKATFHVGQDFVDLFAKFETQATRDLFADFVVRGASSEDLFAEFVIRRSDSQDLFSKFLPKHNKWLNPTHYTEVDVVADRLQFGWNAHRVNVVNLDRDETCYLYQDRGAGKSGVIYEFKVALQIDDYSGTGRVSFICWQDVLGDLTDASNATAIRLDNTATQHRIVLIKKELGVYSWDIYLANTGTWYYCWFKRRGASLVLEIYSDSAYQNLLDTKTLTMDNGATTYRYFNLVASEDTGASGQDIDAYMDWAEEFGEADLKATFHVGQDSIDLFAKFELQKSEDLFAKFVVRNASYEDLPSEFVVRQTGTADLFAEFTVRQGDSEDLFADFAIRQVGTEDLFAKFQLLDVGTADLFSKFIVRQTGTAELFADFTLRRDGSEDLFAETVIRHSETQDLFSEFVVRQTGTQDLFSEFVIRQTGTQDLYADFTVRQTGTQDLFSEFVVRHSAYQELFAKFDVSAIIDAQEDLFAEFVVRHADAADLFAKATIRGTGVAELFSSLRVRHADSENLFAEFIVRHAGTGDLFAEVVIRNAGAVDLFAEFAVRQIASQDLFAKLAIRHSAVQELFAELTIRHTATRDLFSKLEVRKLEGTTDLFAEFIVRHSSFRDLPAEFYLYQIGSAGLFAKFLVVNQGTVDLFSTATIRHSASLDLGAEAVIRHGDVFDIPAEFVVRQAEYADLKAILEIKNKDSVDLFATFLLRQATADLYAKLIIRGYGTRDLHGDFYVRHPTWMWTSRHYVEGVIDLEGDVSDAVLEYVIEGVMVDVQSYLINSELPYQWDNIAEVPKLIKRATTYGTVASLFARGFFKHRLGVAIAPISIIVVDSGGHERAMDHWEGRMMEMLETYRSGVAQEIFWVDTADEEPVFSMEDIPTYRGPFDIEH